MAFIETRFPALVSKGASGGPTYLTTRVETQSGRIYRNARRSFPLYRYQAELGVKTLDQLAEVVNLFNAVRGGLDGFRFKDHADYLSAETITPTDQNLGTGDGSTDTFQLRKAYTYGGQTVYRNIKKPVSGSVRVAVAGAEKTITTHFTVDTTTGVVTFTAGNIPTAGQAVTAGFEFDVPVIFDVDNLVLVHEEADLGALSIPLVEDLNA